MLYSLGDAKVTLRGENHFVAHNATVIGSVILERNVSVWFNVVIRADNDLITIGENTNIQDGSILHVDPGMPLTIGKGVTVGHKAMLHGCTVGDSSLIGINAVVLNGARIGRNCIVGAGALVTENMDIPDNSLVVGSPAVIKRRVTDDMASSLQSSANRYVENGRRFRETLIPDDRPMPQLR
ncbi:MAG: gamma carbonic anhydrase family protein [Desulfuromusa sp.]|nr:gamma carbonic anhydrase family protein [Desulfuromusa sp.]